MRILVVAHTPPWPPTSGARLRLSNIILGLSRLGEIDLFVLANEEGHVPTVDAAVPLRRARAVERSVRVFTIGQRLRWLAGSGLPSDFAGRDYGQVRQAFAEWTVDYDLVWFSRIEAYLALRSLIKAPTIVDIDDLEDWKIRGRLTEIYPLQISSFLSPRRFPGMAAAWIQGLKNIRAWRRLHREVSAGANALVVCSELDGKRLGAFNRFVVPNGYDYQPAPVGRLRVGQPPTIVLPGYFKYPPNVDAAWYFVERILPRIVARIPIVRVRLVGDADDRVLSLRRYKGVVVTGFVEDMRAELATADVIAVPLRFGSGTRIKILEAFAHRIPVVSTALGAEGIDAVDGRQIMLGDTPQSFSDACVRLLTDERCRAAVIHSAHELFLTTYRWDNIHSIVASVGARVAGNGELARPDMANSQPSRVGSHVGRR